MSSQDDKDDGTFQGESGGPFDNEINVEISRPDKRDVGCFKNTYVEKMIGIIKLPNWIVCTAKKY